MPMPRPNAARVAALQRCRAGGDGVLATQPVFARARAYDWLAPVDCVEKKKTSVLRSGGSARAARARTAMERARRYATYVGAMYTAVAPSRKALTSMDMQDVVQNVCA